MTLRSSPSDSLKALRGYDDATLTRAAPHITELLRHHQPDT